MPADVWTNATNHGYFLVMDIAMGGGLADKTGGGPTAATKSGVPLLVDYFSVSSKAGTGTPAPTPSRRRPERPRCQRDRRRPSPSPPP